MFKTPRYRSVLKAPLHGAFGTIISGLVLIEDALDGLHNNLAESFV